MKETDHKFSFFLSAVDVFMKLRFIGLLITCMTAESPHLAQYYPLLFLYYVVNIHEVSSTNLLSAVGLTVGFA